jgi:hypothetical protein
MHEVCELQVPISRFAVPRLGRILSSSDFAAQMGCHTRDRSPRNFLSVLSSQGHSLTHVITLFWFVPATSGKAKRIEVGNTRH